MGEITIRQPQLPVSLFPVLVVKTFLMCKRYSPARRSFVIRWIRTVTSGTGGFIPFSSRSSNGIETFAKRFVQYGLIWRYSIFFVPATISASHSRSIVVVMRS